MFSAISQGSLVHIVDKTDGLKYKTGEVVGVQNNGYNPSNFGTPNFVPGGTLTLKVKIDGNVVDYPEVPVNGSVVSYNNGSTCICESKERAISQIEGILQETKQILANHTKHEQLVKDCEDVLKDLNPIFAKDKERDDRINGLDSKVTSMESKLDKILNVLSTTNNNPSIKI